LCANLGGGFRSYGWINDGLPKNTAALISPLNSRALIWINVFAHNLFHKICEEPLGQGVERLVASFVPGLLAGPRQGSDYTSPGAPGHAQILGVQTYSL
jgi:hypothetical protein